MKNKIVSMLILAAANLITHAAPNNMTIPIELTQDAFNYINPSKINDTVISAAKAKRMQTYFREQYFYQWSNKANQQYFYYVPGVESSKNNILQLEENTIKFYQGKVGYDKNYQLHQSDWIAAVSDNMNLTSFPNVPCHNPNSSDTNSCLGIIVENAQVRSLPSNDAFYHDFTTPGEGYPFDYLQLSALWIGTPVMLMQTTQDGQWVLIKGQATMGWVPIASVAKAAPKFINFWQNAKFVTPLQRRQNLFIKENNIGSLVIQAGSVLAAHNKIMQIPISPWVIYIPTRGEDGYAKLIDIKQNRLNVSPWPISPTYKNFANQINNLSEMPYGWGGKDLNNDCSGLLRRLFTSFGIWLPRSSLWQADYAGKKYSLYGKTQAERKNWLINQQGPSQLIPFMSLISFGNSEEKTSHIALYLGTTQYNKEKTAIMFHAPWGVPMTNNNTKESGRALVAQSLISPVGMGDAFFAGISAQGWSLSSLWDKVGFNVTILTQSPNKQLLLQQQNALGAGPNNTKAYIISK
ncbi:SH3 domain of the SH3b1 type [Piscirickettsia salmonis]|uniref:SH3 domain of the SH3b1 type family protein n=1 Tax=Piscirickettsia salmonis TaxID=1238 RepID=A0A1L6TB62_PISSA|nr:SH3 domain-containing protein [Piscirickettsia salmonis]AKP73762.1 peptide-binding protein [Piscirickettsia salmonis LF-89 = ATCC VR-1361]ALB22553.1 SH3 domain of the SH3b1 type family protein [Piscirickettsia salmonis]ALY02576.1 peptide-binding protein [Piscirickettsia salmonis]AMA42118.1 peptide-binding protein [Piscirickettsia salmonis]AOS34594.1 peptide-binding protein [Piscirickettsia salmonis]